MSSLLLLLCQIYILSSQQIRIKSVNLTALNPSQNGVNVTLPNVNNINDVSIDNNTNQWDITVSSQPAAQKGFHLEIYLDDTWSFHPSKVSIISFTIYSTTSLNVLDLDALISFSVNNTKYVTVWPTLDNLWPNKIYPKCDESNPLDHIAGHQLATGDIKALVDLAHIDECSAKRAGNRDCVATGGEEFEMLPTNTPGHINKWPITILLENDPISNTLFVELSNPSWGDFVQRCGYREAFPTGSGLEIYFALDDNHETIKIDQFTVSLDYLHTNTTLQPTTFMTTISNMSTTTFVTTIPSNMSTTAAIQATEATDESIMDELSALYTTVSIVLFSFFLLIGIIAFIDANKCHKNDLFRISAIIIFGLYSIDFISDIFFAATVYSQKDDNANMLWIFIASCLFLVVPLLLNLVQLKQSIAKWLNDPENGWLIGAYIEDHSRILYIITMLSGSGFASVKLVNSALFRFKLFDMGLKKHQMIEFQNKRLFSVVLMENVPQIVLQTIFAVWSDGVYTITIMALIFSVFSIILSIFEYSTTRSLIKRTRNDVDCCRYIIRFDVVSSHIVKHRKTLKYQQKKITAYIAEILQIDCVLIEQLRSRNINGGLQLLFRLKSVDVSEASIIYEPIYDKIQSGSMTETIKSVWGLSVVPLVKDLKVNQLNASASINTHIQLNTMNKLDSNSDPDPDNMS